MNRLKFWLEKFKFMIIFAWWREWWLVSSEWNITYAQMQEAEANSEQICKEAVERILNAIEEE